MKKFWQMVCVLLYDTTKKKESMKVQRKEKPEKPKLVDQCLQFTGKKEQHYRYRFDLSPY